ncbi:MAG: enoyl-CoA hydratase-related protein [Proteobacteria bacterium]|nr:enoyl-CoA hydratase-related protein [Pseudomonadota bacterium]
MEYDNIAIEDKGEYAVITINRPGALNALSSTVIAELITAVNEIELNDDLRVIAVTGAGDRAFVAGADIGEIRDLGSSTGEALAEMGGNLLALIESSVKPYIAAVNGFALGGGCELALACDFIYASSAASFGQPEVKLGIIPGFGGTQRLARRIGVGKAKELILSGDTISAEEALRIGLCDKVVAPDQLMIAVKDVAQRIARNGPLAVAEAKKLIHVGQSMSLDTALLLEQRTFGALCATEDKAEGTSAFLDKRPASFRGK